MMKTFSLPYTIKNNHGEQLTFKELVQEDDGTEKVLVEGLVAPGCGPVLHAHLKQDEYLEVKHGKMGYELGGEPARFLTVGQGVLFPRGVVHRFWNAGEEDLVVTGYVTPPNSFVFYLSTLYAAQAQSRTPQPEPFMGAYLITRYRSEYDLPEIPGFVKNVIMPVTVFIGRLLGKYKHLEGAPAPL
ncbi:MAG: cupin domain-containing protein [Lewinella sp.]|nr:cupin domain-containing protein [Lewinella sp.]